MLRIRNKLNFKLIGLTLMLSMFLGVGFTLSSYASEPTSYGFGPAENSDLTAEKQSTRSIYDYPQLRSVEISKIYKNYKNEWIVEIDVTGTTHLKDTSRLIGLRCIYNLGVRAPRDAIEFIGRYRGLVGHSNTMSDTVWFTANE